MTSGNKFDNFFIFLSFRFRETRFGECKFYLNNKVKEYCLKPNVIEFKDNIEIATRNLLIKYLNNNDLRIGLEKSEVK
jgi:hypothetical protein